MQSVNFTPAKRHRRHLHGILLIDKPLGFSSNQVLMRVRYLLQPMKLGHTGTLDPLATGMLPICFGEATKLAAWMLGHRKLYRAVIKLGITTETGDREGAVTSERAVDDSIDSARIDESIEWFRGEIEQVPPIYSAIKVGNEPAYRRVRRGESVELPPRRVMIHRFERVAFSGDELTVDIDCGGGTYVRSLAIDLGEKLGCGAHVQSLHRVWVEPFEELPMVSVEAFDAMDLPAREACLLSMDAGLRGWARIDLSESEAQRMAYGNQLPWPASAAPVRARAYAPDGRLIALVEPVDGKMVIERGFNL